MKLLLLILSVLALNAQARSQKRYEPTPSPIPHVSPTATPEAPVIGDRVKFKPVEYYTTKAQREKIISAGHKMNEVVQSQCFFDFMSKQKLNTTNGRTPSQVAAHLQSLAGTIPVEMYDPGWFSNAIAYRQPPRLTIHLSYNHFSPSMDDCDWAETMGHESLGHSLGEYDHTMKWTRAREDTVPYVIGGRIKSYGGSAFDLCCKREAKK